MAFNELTPIDWAVQTLLNSAEVTALVGNRIDADDNVPELLEGDDVRDYFPRLIYSGTPHGTPHATGLVLGWGEFLFTALCREDAVAPGADLRESAVSIAQAVEEALSLCPAPGILGDGKTLHGAQLIDIFAPPIYGPQGKRICARGRLFSLIWS